MRRIHDPTHHQRWTGGADQSDDRLNMDVTTPTTPISRRSLMLAGLGSAATIAAGCTTGSAPRRDADLPGPLWPHDNRPAPQPAAPSASATMPLQRVRVVPRSNWTAAQPNRGEARPLNGVARITVHHDGMDPVPLRSPQEVADRLETIRRVHVENNGWADIGYHFAVDPQGRVWATRPLDLQGAHVKNENEHNMGILVLGNFEMQTPTPAAMTALDGLLVEAAMVNRVPLANIRTHREWNPTACPGASLQQHMNIARSPRGRVAARVA
ncbi:MAG: peptidoglycan recognition family protein [Planctomycetota bacterium]